MPRATACALLAAVTIITFTIPGTATQIVEIRLRGHYFSAPATVVVNIAVEPASDHYRLIVEADSAKFFRASEIELAGANEKRIHTLQFKNLPEGQYMLRAQVQSRTETLGQATQELRVMGIGGR